MSFGFRALQPGKPALEQIFPGKPGLRFDALDDERTSKADLRGPDRAGNVKTLRGRPVMLLGARDHMAVPAGELGMQQELGGYQRAIGLSNVNPKNLIGVPFSGGVFGFTKAVRDFVGENPSELRSRGVKRVVPWIHSAEAAEIAKLGGLETENTTVDAVDIANDKLEFQRAAKKHGIPTAEYRHPTSIKQAINHFRQLQALARRHPDIYSSTVYVKLQRSCAGRGVEKVTTVEELVRWLTEYPERLYALTSGDKYEGVILEAGLIPRDENASPNINFYITDDEEADMLFLCGTIQALARGTAHAGNNGPIGLNHRDFQAAEPALRKCIKWLRSIGYRGPVGIDLLFHKSGKVYVIETNARWNGSTAAGLKHAEFADQPEAASFRYIKIPAPKGTAVNRVAEHLQTTKIDGKPIELKVDSNGRIERGVGLMSVGGTVFADSDKDSGYHALVIGPNERVLDELTAAAEMP